MNSESSWYTDNALVWSCTWAHINILTNLYQQELGKCLKSKLLGENQSQRCENRTRPSEMAPVLPYRTSNACPCQGESLHTCNAIPSAPNPAAYILCWHLQASQRSPWNHLWRHAEFKGCWSSASNAGHPLDWYNSHLLNHHLYSVYTS